MTTRFSRFARTVSDASGHPIAFILAFLVILIWAVSGPFLGFSEVWQLTVSSGRLNAISPASSGAG